MSMSSWKTEPESVGQIYLDVSCLSQMLNIIQWLQKFWFLFTLCFTSGRCREGKIRRRMWTPDGASHVEKFQKPHWQQIEFLKCEAEVRATKESGEGSSSIIHRWAKAAQMWVWRTSGQHNEWAHRLIQMVYKRSNLWLLRCRPRVNGTFDESSH